MKLTDVAEFKKGLTDLDAGEVRKSAPQISGFVISYIMRSHTRNDNPGMIPATVDIDLRSR